MTENIKKLLELASSNEELKTKLTEASKDELIAIAKEQGINLCDEDFEAKPADLSDDELDSIAGGKKCYCALGGGGTGEDSNNTKTCACVGSGAGNTKSGGVRCACVLGGYGDNVKQVMY